MTRSLSSSLQYHTPTFVPVADCARCFTEKTEAIWKELPHNQSQHLFTHKSAFTSLPSHFLESDLIFSCQLRDITPEFFFLLSPTYSIFHTLIILIQIQTCWSYVSDLKLSPLLPDLFAILCSKTLQKHCLLSLFLSPLLTISLKFNWDCAHDFTETAFDTIPNNFHIAKSNGTFVFPILLDWSSGFHSAEPS